MVKMNTSCISVKEILFFTQEREEEKSSNDFDFSVDREEVFSGPDIERT